MEEKYRWYRTEIPNTLDDAGLSPSAYRLYGHIKRVAGDNGKCRDTTRQMADKCKMSIGMVSEAKKELLDAGFINVAGRGAHGLDIIEVINIWPQNYEKYSQRSHYEHCESETERSDSEHDATQSSDSEHKEPENDVSVHIMNANDRTRSHYEHNKKEQTTKEQLQQQKLAANAAVASDDADHPPPKSKPKVPKSANPQIAALKAAFVEAYGTDKFNHAQVGVGIKQLDGIGCTPDELKGCYEWLKSDTWWEFKPVFPQTIFKQLPEYRRYLERKIHANGAQNGKPSNRHTDPSLDVYAAYT